MLGGLLSAYHLTGHDPLLLDRAIDLADRILPVFETASGLPLPVINLAEKKGYHTTDFPGLVSIAEVGTLQLEFRYLSEVTRNPTYWEKVEKVWVSYWKGNHRRMTSWLQIMGVVSRARLPHGMASIFMK